MKPTPQISSNKNSSRRDSRACGDQQGFPLTDYDFQSTVETAGKSNATTEQSHGVRELRTFRQVSREFFGAEASIVFATEAFFFISILGVAAWPLTVMMHQLLRWMI